MNKENLEAYYEKSKQLEPGQFTTHLEKYYNFQLQASSGVTYDIKEIRHIWWRNSEISKGETEAITEYDKDMANPIKTVGIEDYELYVKDGYEYVVTSNSAYKSYLMPDSPKGRNFPSYKKFYEDLFRNGMLIKEFNPRKLKAPGPTVKIIKMLL